MKLIDLSAENLDREHICCAITEKKGETCVASKKAWLRERFSDGLVFKRLDARGKVFIEYLPAGKAWCPIDADGYMHIDCFWVSGQFKGQGYANQLLDACIADAKAKGMQGLTVLASDKKRPFLSDPKNLKYKGFQVADRAEPFFELLYLPFSGSAPVPRFKPRAKEGRTAEPGLVLYYTAQCPHCAKYAPLIEQTARAKGVDMVLHELKTAEQARSSPTPFPTYSLFYNGAFVTNEILSEAKFQQFLEARGI